MATRIDKASRIDGFNRRWEVEEIQSRIDKLPKWAQTHIVQLERRLDHKDKVISELKETIVKPDWHNHEFWELRMDEEHDNRRYICASSLNLDCAGLTVQLTPRPDCVTVNFDVNYDKPREHGEHAVIVPVASNSIEIKRMNAE